MKIKKKKTSVFLHYVYVVESVHRFVQFLEKHPFYTLLGNKGFQQNYILKWWTYWQIRTFHYCVDILNNMHCIQMHCIKMHIPKWVHKLLVHKLLRHSHSDIYSNMADSSLMLCGKKSIFWPILWINSFVFMGWQWLNPS